MSLLNERMVEYEFRNQARLANHPARFTTAEIDKLKEIFAATLWAVFLHYQEQEVSIKIWFFRKKFKLKALYNVFEYILGPVPLDKGTRIEGL